jgi:tetratricopeptide (TPR) repeat protein
MAKFFCVLAALLCGSYRGESAEVRSIHLRNVWENSAAEDSVRFHALEVFYEFNHQTNPDTTLSSLEYHLKLALDKSDLTEQFYALKRQGNILRLQRKYARALETYRKAGNIARSLNNSLFQADILGNIANVYVYQSDYLNASRFFYEALDIYERFNHKKGIIRMHTSIGNVFLIIKKYNLALDYYLKVLNGMDPANDRDKTLGIIYSNIGLSYYWLGDYERARGFCEKGIANFEHNGNLIFAADSYGDLARIYEKLEEYQKAKEAIEQCLELNTRLSVEEGVTEAKLIQAQLAFHEHPGKGLLLAEPLMDEVRKFDNKGLKKELYYLLYQCYKHIGNDGKSLEMHELYTLFSDSVNQELHQFEILQEVIQREHQVQLAQFHARNKEASNAARMKQLKVLAVVSFTILILVATALLVFQQYRARNKARLHEVLAEIETLKKNKQRELMVHAEVFRLNREQIELALSRKLNETDWLVLNILLGNPTISNKKLAEQANLSVDGIGSSLRRMYEYFEVGESRYKKIALITAAIQSSGGVS